jgi:hypothetical protein
MYPPVTQFETRQRMILDELRVREERRLVRRSTPRIPRATRQRASATGGDMHRGQRRPGVPVPRIQAPWKPVGFSAARLITFLVRVARAES